LIPPGDHQKTVSPVGYLKKKTSVSGKNKKKRKDGLNHSPTQLQVETSQQKPQR